MNMGTPDPIANQGKILKSHGIERVKESEAKGSLTAENVVMFQV